MKGTDIRIGDIVVISKASSRKSNRTFQPYGQKARVVELGLHEPYSYSKRTSATRVVLLDKDGKDRISATSNDPYERVIPNRDLISVEDFKALENEANKRADERDHRNTLRVSEVKRVEAILRAAGIPDSSYRVSAVNIDNGTAAEVDVIRFDKQGISHLLRVLEAAGEAISNRPEDWDGDQ